MTNPIMQMEPVELARWCTANDFELLTPREAARLFGVQDATVRTAASEGKIHPVWRLSAVRDLPLYKLTDLREYFGSRSTADPALLATMRENGITCAVQGGGCWLLLCERPGLQRWEEAAS